MDVQHLDLPAVPVSASRAARTPSASDRIRVIVESSVAQVFGISPALLRSVTRGRARVALARQVAMYLSHVAFCLSLTDVGRIFGRDRTTVSHACGVVEDLRDDPRFDRVLDMLERIIRFQARPQIAEGPAGQENLQ
jgi:chromosomal replication initiation ATPase DnaA